jgi:hypothetical protein
MTPLRQIKQQSPRKMPHQNSNQRCRCPYKRLKLALMHYTLTKTSLTKAATVDKPPSPFSANVIVQTASLIIMEKIFRLGQEQQRLHKIRALKRKSHL